MQKWNHLKKSAHLSLSMITAFSLCLPSYGSPNTVAAKGDETIFSNAQKLKIELEKNKINSKYTYGEFWETVKSDVPSEQFKDLEAYFKAHANTKMPNINVKEVKNSLGETKLNLVINDQGKEYVLQVLDDGTNAFKFNKVLITQNDVERLRPFLDKIAASDYKIRNQMSAAFGEELVVPKTYVKPQSTPSRSSKTPISDLLKQGQRNANSNNNLPLIGQEQWKKLTLTQKVDFILRLRLAHSAASEVLFLEEKMKNETNKSPIKTNSKNKNSNFNFLLQELLNKAWGDEPVPTTVPAPGAQVIEAKNVTTPVTNAPGAGSAGNSVNCVVAGFVSEYGRASNGKKACLFDKVESNYTTRYGADNGTLGERNQNKLLANTFKSCLNGSIPCNPLIYGWSNYETKTPLCVERKNIQRATIATGPAGGTCEDQSPLRTPNNKPLFINDQYTNVDQLFNPDNLNYKDNDNFMDEENKKNAEAFLKSWGIHLEELKLTASTSPAWNVLNSKFALISDIQKIFDTEIKNGRESCKKNYFNREHMIGNRYIDPNFKQACQQLYKRSLNLRAYFDSVMGCENKTKINEDFMCVCSTPPNVRPGIKCANGPVPPPIQAEKCADTKIYNNPQDFEFNLNTNSCECKNPNFEKVTENMMGTGMSSWQQYSCKEKVINHGEQCELIYPGINANEVDPTDCKCLPKSISTSVSKCAKSENDETEDKCFSNAKPTNRAGEIPRKKLFSGKPGQYTCEKLNWQPWAFGAAVVGIGLLWHKNKKKKSTPSPVICFGGATAFIPGTTVPSTQPGCGCPNTCTNGQVRITNGSCQCGPPNNEFICQPSGKAVPKEADCPTETPTNATPSPTPSNGNTVPTKTSN